ncbi:hypothetical protein EDD85DRAFT_941456 [Armillaria nabsnona]|nr:hypothetical protein EDD85DRAFT_941456 [Armillaria nabsnona]
MASALRGVQLGPEGVRYQALHVSILDRFKSFRDRHKLLIYISRILPGGLGTHAALIDDLPAAFSMLKHSAHDLVDDVDAFELRVFRFRDCFMDSAWVETMVGNPVLVRGMVDVLYSIDNERWSIRSKLHKVSTGPIGIIPESVLFNL